jgi:DNA-binding MarR family transcriptional regulator
MNSRPNTMSSAVLPDDPKGRVEVALMRVLRALVFRGDAHSPLIELPNSQLRCLHIVGEQEGQKMVELAHRMEIKLPALSQIVDRLVKRGMVERHADPQDRRVVRLGLTPQARELVAEAHQARQARMDATLQNLSPQALEEVIQGLQLLARAAETQEAEERQAQDAAQGEMAAGDAPIEPLRSLNALGRRSRRAKVLVETVPEVSPLD